MHAAYLANIGPVPFSSSHFFLHHPRGLIIPPSCERPIVPFFVLFAVIAALSSVVFSIKADAVEQIAVVSSLVMQIGVVVETSLGVSSMYFGIRSARLSG